MGVARALLNAVFQQLVVIPRERSGVLKRSEHMRVCVCNGENESEQEKGIYDMDSLAR